MLHRLYGGVHLHDRKAATRGVEVTALDRAPTYVVLPMIMHVGEPCTPIVAVGDHVLLGQKIAQPTGLGAPIHASVSGTVTAIEPRPYADGVHVMSVVIENDFQDTPAPPLERKANPENLTCWEVVDLIAEAGIVGLGGMGHPTAAKLKDAIGKVDTLIINGIECEPYLTADHRLMLEDGERILGGAEILMHALNLNTALLGIDANKMNGIRALRSMLSEERGIQIVTLKNRYPQGADTQLVRKLTGRQVPRDKLTTDVKCVVFNVATAAAVCDAVIHGIPLTHRIVTVSGGSINQPLNLRVPIGTPLKHLAEECGSVAVLVNFILLSYEIFPNSPTMCIFAV